MLAYPRKQEVTTKVSQNLFDRPPKKVGGGRREGPVTRQRLGKKIQEKKRQVGARKGKGGSWRKEGKYPGLKKSTNGTDREGGG